MITLLFSSPVSRFRKAHIDAREKSFAIVTNAGPSIYPENEILLPAGFAVGLANGW